MTRLAVTYEILPIDDLRTIVRLAHDRGALVYVDDAGGARVGPAVFDQPRTLQLGVDVVATGLDKYGTVGPRLGVLAGDKALVARIRGRAYEMGMVHTVVPAADLERATYDLAKTIAGNAPLSLAGMKSTIRRALSLRERVEHKDLDEIARRARASADAREGVRAMLEHRTPTFRGQ